MKEIALIAIQIIFIIFLFNFSVYEITDRLKIKYLNTLDIMFVNILLLINTLLFFSLVDITINYLFFIIMSLTLLGFAKSIKNKKTKFINNKSFIFIIFILSWIISIDLAANIDLGWDAKNYGIFKTLNFYQNNNLSNLTFINNTTEYPHLGQLLWAFFWKFPLNYNEYFGRISFIVIYLISIFAFYSNLKIGKINKLIFIFLTILITYEYHLFNGLSEVLIFSLILMASKFAFLLLFEKNNNNQTKLILYILLITNAACWIKNEALIFMLIFNFGLLFSDIKYNTKIKLFIGSLLVVFIRVFFFIYADIESNPEEFGATLTWENFNFLEKITDLKLIMFYIIVYMIEIPIYLLAIPLFFYIFLGENKNYNFNKFLILCIILNFLFIIIAFLFNVENVDFQVRNSLKRIMFETAGFYLMPILLILNNKKYRYNN